MPRVTITFDLPEESPDFRAAIDGGEYLLRLQAIDEFCRIRLKHHDRGPDERSLLEHIRNMIGEVHE